MPSSRSIPLEPPRCVTPGPEGGVTADGDRSEALGFDLRPRRRADPPGQDPNGLRAVAQLTPGVAAPRPQGPVGSDAEEVDVADVGAPPGSGDARGLRSLRRRAVPERVGPSQAPDPQRV